ncbi:regulator of G-protein signaling 9-binding protein-like [Gigantopelta aegis]|uniref:regulator of G-protein signaling 9-binding protein-like n=1 Tax=Gigantopelta aegis TaxID=1735272 RepID=UPI001B8875F6|nr:regulator of G-protein signaling 9-binding protein-like [Gigantopelta aegis]
MASEYYHFQTRHETSSSSSHVNLASGNRVGIGEEGSSVSRSCEECTKYVLSLNREIALYANLAVGLGASNDSDRLREELRHSRRRATDLAYRTKRKLIPLIRYKMRRQEDATTLTRLYMLYSGCLELLELHLIKSMHLLSDFPLHTDSKILINTGISDPVSVIACKLSVASTQTDCLHVETAVLESEAINRLRSDVSNIHALLYETSQAIDVRPWDVEPNLSTDLCDFGKSSGTRSNSLTIIHMNETIVGNRARRKKKIWTIVFLLILAVTAICVTGLSVGLLS